MPTVKFVKEKKEIEVPAGTNLRAAAVQAGINLNQGAESTLALLSTLQHARRLRTR